MRSTLLLTCLFCSTFMFAQASFGLKGGLSMATVGSISAALDGGEEVKLKFEWHPLFHGGLWGRFDIGTKWTVQPELLYTQKAVSFQEPEGGAKRDLDYLSIPILFQINHRNLRFGLGPEFSYLLNHNDLDFVSKNDNLEIGLNLDASWHLNKWTINLRYTRDLTAFSEVEFTDVNGVPSENPSKFKNRTIQLGVGYTLFQKI